MSSRRRSVKEVDMTARRRQRGVRAMQTRRQAALAAGRAANVRVGGFTGMEKKFADFETSADAFATTWAAGIVTGKQIT